MVKHDVAVEVRGQADGCLFFRRLHDVADAVQRDAGLAHLRNHPAEHAHRPGHHGAVRQKRDIRPCMHGSADAEHRAEDHRQQNLQPGKHVARTPESGQRLCKLHPKAGVVAVLLFKTVALVALTPEGPHHAHAGQVLLRQGREHALVLVAGQKSFADLFVEMQGIRDDDGHRQHGNQRQARVHAQHKHNRKRQQNQDTDEVRHLLCQEVLQRVDVRSAALNDIAGPVFHVPGIGQALNVGKEAVTHGLDQRLGGRRLADFIAVLGGRLYHGDRSNGKRENPDLLPQHCDAARPVNQAYGKGGQRFCRGAAQNIIHRNTDDLRCQHIGQRRQRGSQHARKEEQPAAPQELSDHLPVIQFFCPGYNGFSPVLYAFMLSSGAGIRSGARSVISY